MRPIRIALLMLMVACAAGALVSSAAAAVSGNPFARTPLYVLKPGETGADAADQAQAWSTSHPGAAAQLRKIASQPWAEWYGGWLPDPGALFRQRVATRYAPTHTTAFIAVHNLPQGDCSAGVSAGGATSAPAYRAWINNMAAAIGSYPTIVVIEPDGLPDAWCVGPRELERMELIRYATRTLAALPDTSVYIDAGRSGWLPAGTTISLLRRAGVQYARGFALDVTGYSTTADELSYGDQIGRALGGKHFIVNTSRNGNGRPSSSQVSSTQELWCNTPGRALGAKPTWHTGDPLADAFEWVLHPGYSDGFCQGGPVAGKWWLPYALGLARRAHW